MENNFYHKFNGLTSALLREIWSYDKELIKVLIDSNYTEFVVYYHSGIYVVYGKNSEEDKKILMYFYVTESIVITDKKFLEYVDECIKENKAISLDRCFEENAENLFFKQDRIEKVKELFISSYYDIAKAYDLEILELSSDTVTNNFMYLIFLNKNYGTHKEIGYGGTYIVSTDDKYTKINTMLRKESRYGVV